MVSCKNSITRVPSSKGIMEAGSPKSSKSYLQETITCQLEMIKWISQCYPQFFRNEGANSVKKVILNGPIWQIRIPLISTRQHEFKKELHLGSK